MIKVCAICEFTDLQAGVHRKIGERFEVDKNRYFEILEKGGDWIVAIKDIEKDNINQKSESKNKTTKKTKGTRKGE